MSDILYQNEMTKYESCPDIVVTTEVLVLGETFLTVSSFFTASYPVEGFRRDHNHGRMLKTLPQTCSAKASLFDPDGKYIMKIEYYALPQPSNSGLWHLY
jgi:hypothetical protein